MDFTNFWLKNPPQGPGGDPGDPINYSLRFRGSQVITRTLTDGGLAGKDWCCSFWVKNSDIRDGEGPIFTLGDSTVGNWFLSTLSGRFSNRTSGGNYQPWTTDTYQRDPAAWYHCYFEGDTSNIVNMWLNGVKQANPIGMGGMTKPMNFGHETNNTSGQGYQGYLASVYFIEGEHLGPNTFARTNEHDIWVPVTPESIASFGSNGFHLEFDPTNWSGSVVQDQSGNGNDFTYIGIGLDDTVKDYDLMLDTPTQNAATWNQADVINYVNLTDGSLITSSVQGPNWVPAYLTFGPFECGQPGKYYFELDDDEATGYKTCNFGVTNENKSVTEWTGFWWDEGDTLSWYPESGNFYRNGASAATGSSASTSGGKGMAIDFETGTITGYEYESGDVIDLTGLSSPLTDGEKYYIVAGTSNTNDTRLPFNFGQRPFKQPIPEGYTTLNSINLPEAPILNGRDHFQAIEALGSGSGGGADQIIGGFSIPWTASGDGFGSKPPSNAFVADVNEFCNNNTGGQTITWDTSSFNLVGELTISMRESGAYTMSIDGVEVISAITDSTTPSDYTVTVNNPQSIVWTPVPSQGSGIYLYNFSLDGKNLRDGSIIAIAQQIFPEGLWWIKDRENTNQHQLVDSIRGSSQVSTMPNNAWTAYDVPLGACAGWLWSAPDVMDQTTRESGTINVTEGRINPTSGFSMVTYTGNTVAGSTIAHGLGQTPAMIITHGAPDQPAVYHQGLNMGDNPQNFRMRLSGLTAQDNNIVFWNNTAPDSQFFTVGTDSAMNHAIPYVAYCWAEIPGYSKFGHYFGTGNDDGPFQYCGFKPAFIMYRRIDVASNWVIHDTTRNVTNPSFLRLVANSDGNEGNARTMEVDILSNGFKHRNSDADLNGNANGYIYCAFAENPFSYPVTAR